MILSLENWSTGKEVWAKTEMNAVLKDRARNLGEWVKPNERTLGTVILADECKKVHGGNCSGRVELEANKCHLVIKQWQVSTVRFGF